MALRRVGPPVAGGAPRVAGVAPVARGRGALRFAAAQQLHCRRLSRRGMNVVASPQHLIAVYPGTFDPMTLGHEDLMRRASRLFDKLILAVAAGHHKRTMFTIAERLEIATEIALPYKNVEVVAFRGL